MQDILVLRLDAPLMAFGGVAVDNRGVIQDFPALSTLAGLLGNALGYDHGDAERLEALQRRLRYAARRDRPGKKLLDFQTVALGQPFLERGWTTRGAPEGRGGAFSGETHIRFREYWADAVYTVALRLDPAVGDPDLERLERAVCEPERPLFIGRKACLPAAPLLLGKIKASSLLEAVSQAQRLDRARWGEPVAQPLTAWIPGDEEVTEFREVPVTDERDWANQLVVGRRIVKQTTVNPPEVEDAR